ncbi:MAG: STM4014 family protein [Lachnospiraceae bacterium]|nr:STM4014 family protein [Lachnospiraceae bacterium]
MKKIILVGCEGTKRTDYFLKAARELEIPVSFENIFQCVQEELEEAVVKIDPFVYQEVQIEQMEALLGQYTGLLNRFAANKKLQFLNHPDAIQEVLHKVRCKEKLMEQGVPVTKMLGTHINCLEELKQLMLSKREYAVFIKPVQSSGAAGIAAYRFYPERNREVLYTCGHLEQGQLINTKKLYRIEDSVQIRSLLDRILSMESMVERWYPKADYQGKKYDLRVVWQFGKVDFVVARQSKGPITNLHLNNQALPVEELKLPAQKQEEIVTLCTNAMKLFPALSYAGIDIMLEKNTLEPLIIEINGQGDLLYQDIFQDNCIYKNQLLHMYQLAQQN